MADDGTQVMDRWWGSWGNVGTVARQTKFGGEVRPQHVTLPPGAKRYPVETYARRDAQVAYVIEIRAAKISIRYEEQVKAVQKKFGCARLTAERAITMANEKLHQEFRQFAADAPRIILDAYLDIHSEAMRVKNWNAARRALDSVRDMFGIKTPTQIFVNNGPPAEAFAALSDEELAVAMKLEQHMISGAIDAVSVPSANVDERDDET